jgi:hypothetical protein
MTTPVFGLPIMNYVLLCKIAFVNIRLICIVVKKARSIGEVSLKNAHDRL